MNTFISLNKCQFNVLEIKTIDNKSIYVPREWFISISHYFKSLLTNGCEEFDSNLCYLGYESKFLLILFDTINSFHRPNFINYLYTNFSKLTTIEDIYNFASMLTEYQLDGIILQLFDSYLANNKELLKSIMTSRLIDTLYLFNFKETQVFLLNVLNENIDIIKLLDYTNINFEFVELFFEHGIKIHFKIFRLWTAAHQPTEKQLMKSKLLKYDYKHFSELTPRTQNKIFNLVFNLKNVDNFKAAMYEMMLRSIYDNHYTKKFDTIKNNVYKNFIKNEVENSKLNNTIDYIELTLQIREKWLAKFASKNDIKLDTIDTKSTNNDRISPHYSDDEAYESFEKLFK